MEDKGMEAGREEVGGGREGAELGVKSLRLCYGRLGEGDGREFTPVRYLIERGNSP